MKVKKTQKKYLIFCIGLNFRPEIFRLVHPRTVQALHDGRLPIFQVCATNKHMIVAVELHFIKVIDVVESIETRIDSRHSISVNRLGDQD